MADRFVTSVNSLFEGSKYSLASAKPKPCATSLHESKVVGASAVCRSVRDDALLSLIALPSKPQKLDTSGGVAGKLGARAAGSAPDGTCAGAPLAQRADASRSPRKSWTRPARPLTPVPGGGVPAQARNSRAPPSPIAPFSRRELGPAPSRAAGGGLARSRWTQSQLGQVAQAHARVAQARDLVA